MKKLLLLLLMVVGVLGLTACNLDTEIVVEADGTYTAVQRVYTSLDDMQMFINLYQTGFFSSGDVEVTDSEMLDKLMSIKTDEEFEELLKEVGYELEPVIVDGKKYFADPNQVMDITDDVEQDPNCRISADTFEYKVNIEEAREGLLSDSTITAEDQQMIDILFDSVIPTVRVTMPNEILFTNGVLSEDKKSVTFRYDLRGKNTFLYAYCDGSDGIIQLNTKEGGYTNKDVVKVNTPDNVEQLTVNGETVKSGKQIELEEDGIYNIDIVTECSEKSMVVVKDTKAPKIKGVKNGKTYNKKVTIKYSDDVSGIKSAKLNGKRIKSGKKVKKAGDYTLVVTDNAGNKTTVKFSIKK